MVALFHQNLTETAFGKWNHYIREVLKYLKQHNHHFFCPELLAYYETIETGSKAVKYKGEIEYIDANGDLQMKKQEATAIGMLINFRNRYLGHGLTLDADASEKIWQEYFPIFRTLLEKMSFAQAYPMHKIEDGESWILHTAEITRTEYTGIKDENIWMQNPEGKYLSILPFFIVPGELAVANMDKAKVFAYESYTGKTIKFFSPEGTEKQTSGKILERLNLLLREKQKESPFSPEQFDKDTFLKRIGEENAILLDTLVSERKIISGVYQHREQMEIKLREWIGARANILFIAAEAGSGKTNLLAEMQRQYRERGYPTLLIRAGRMEKTSLQAQVAYLLNIDASAGLQSYGAISGSQSEPTFILIDGLNEARESESIWREILDWSKSIDPGSIKFVITSRANSKADLERFALSADEHDLLYGETKENEKGLDAHVFWLTPMDMKEMKGAWESYLAKDKSRFKPLFSFDDLATFDRGLYDQISNPLVLRLFLEVYNGKPLPRKGGKHLHIWQDWFNTFSAEEQTFLRLLTDEVWLKGSNELLLDDLLQHEKLKPYISSDLVNSPYARMKNLGWLSRYMKDMNACIGFTVEGSLLFLLGKKLQQQVPVIDVAYIKNVLSGGKKLQRSAIESFLCEQALVGDLTLVTDLIDAEVDYMDICVKPLLYILKSKGVEYTIDKILNHPTENDWKAFNELDKKLNKLQLFVIRKEFLNELMKFNSFQTNGAMLLGLKACELFDRSVAEFYLKKINEKKGLIEDNPIILSKLGDVNEKFGNYDQALNFYQKCFDIELKTLGAEHPNLATSYGNLGLIWAEKGDYNQSLEFSLKCLDIQLKAFGSEHPSVATSYNNIGVAWADKGDYEQALAFYQKGLDINLKTKGSVHPSIAAAYNNIASALESKGDYDQALEFSLKCLDIALKTYGPEHPNVALAYKGIGVISRKIGDNDKALNFFHKGLEIELKALGSDHPSVGISYNNIGSAWDNKGNYDQALAFYQKGLDIHLKIFGSEHPSVATSYNNIGSAWDNKGNYDQALDFYQKALNIRLKTFDAKHPDFATTYFEIGTAYKNLLKLNLAIESYEIGFSIVKLGGFPFNIAECYKALGNKVEAMSFYIESAVIRKNHPDMGLEDESTQTSIQKAKQLAMELGKLEELPDWMT
jgi:tetratricopeptide (TPR) repeat protein